VTPASASPAPVTSTILRAAGGVSRGTFTFSGAKVIYAPAENWPDSGTESPAVSAARRAKVIESRAHLAVEGVFMGLGIPELIVILFIIILIFGASRLPEIGRGLGKGIRNFKDATRGGPKD